LLVGRFSLDDFEAIEDFALSVYANGWQRFLNQLYHVLLVLEKLIVH
jgi:hypothetical protein